uniref:Protein AATF n=1 Tax=Ascaris suum TaxID=6253 RepID=F1L3J8_ASCSU
MSSVKDFLDSLNKPIPELPDLEDNDNLDGTWAHHSQKLSPVTTQDEAIVGRRRLHIVAEDTDPKYGAEVVSSKSVFGDYELSGLAQSSKTHSDESESESESDEDHDDDDDDDKEQSEEDDEASDDDDMEGSASEQGLIPDQDDNNDEEKSVDDEEGKDDEATIHVQNALAAVSLESQKKKGESIRKQLLIWDRLMHLQIKLHAALRVYNQLPRGKLARQLLREADEKTVHDYRQVRKNTLALLEILLNAEDALLRSSKQTKNIVTKKATTNQADGNSEDEEVVSSPDEKEEEEEDTGDEMQDDDDGSIPDYKEEPSASGDDEKEEQDKESKPKGRHSMRHIEAELCKRHKRFEEFRNSTLKKWDERTRLVGIGAAKSAKHNFSAFESVVMKQIAQIMADKHRLIRRTQTKRSDAERIGGNAEATYDVELFDDDDFYQQLLKDLIERKSAEVVDPIEMSKQWLEMQKLRQKRSKNKKVDTKASKGRKIRYVVIPKLVNYYPSSPEKVKWSHETRNQLFKSLFAA